MSRGGGKGREGVKQRTVVQREGLNMVCGPVRASNRLYSSTWSVMHTGSHFRTAFQASIFRQFCINHS